MPLPIRRSRVLPVHPLDVLRRCIQTGCPSMQISKGVPLALRQPDGPHINTAVAGSTAVADPRAPTPFLTATPPQTFRCTFWRNVGPHTSPTRVLLLLPLCSVVYLTG